MTEHTERLVRPGAPHTDGAPSTGAARAARPIAWGRVGYAALAAAAALVIWFALARPVQVLPRIRPLPSFTLTDQRARWFGDADMRGAVTLVTFGYASCGAACAEAEAEAQAARDMLRAEGQLGSAVRLLTISLDSDRDTPAALRGYADRLGAQAPEWLLLTGAPAEVKQLVGGSLGLFYAERDGQIVFDRRTLLVDAGGTIRAEYSGPLDLAILTRDLGLIAREAQGSGLERPIYEAAHLFVCYPQ